jgi:hypothetical protein
MSEMLPPVLSHMQSLGHKVFLKGAYNLNLFGIRSKNRKSNQFDDLIGCIYRETEDGPLVARFWEATCDPGTYWLENPMRVEGCAIYKCGQYRGVYELGMHRGKYKALVQTGAKIEVYRDNDLDSVLEMKESSVVSGYFGCNVHKAGSDSSQVNKWSAGCQVFARSEDFEGPNGLMELVQKQIEHHPTWTKITYTLMDEW